MALITIIPKDISPQVDEIIETFGFKDQEEFVQEAVRDKVLELKRRLFMAGSDKISIRLQQKGISEKDILSEFMNKIHRV